MKKQKNNRVAFLIGATLCVLALASCPGSGGDASAPTIGSVSPLEGSAGANVGSSVMATFSEEMDGATIDGASFTLFAGAAEVSGAVSYSDGTAIFNPDADLEYLTEYTATVAAGVADVSGNAMGAAKVWSFTTSMPPDTVAPLVVYTMPADAATGVSITASPAIRFNEAMAPGTIIAANFTVMAGATPVAGSVTYDIPNTKAIFSPAANLAYNTEYTCTVSAAVTDVAGNPMAIERTWSFTTTDLVGAGPAPVRLGTAGAYVVLAKTAITNIPSSAITGDIGLGPAPESYITGFSQTKATGYSTSPQVTGFIYAADMTPPTPANMTTAIADMEAAYTDAAGRPCAPANLDLSGGTIGGLSFAPGVYRWGSDVQMDADITVAGLGGSNDVWIFQISGNLVVASGKQVVLSGGAQARNIFWQIAGIATLDTGAAFEGIILSQTQVQMLTGATLVGRALAQTQVTLDQNSVTAPAF